MTSQKVVVKCTFCDTPYNYDFTTDPRMWCNKCNKQFRFKSQLSASQSSPKPKIPKSNKNNFSQPPQIIDDPNELLMSCAMRELNKQDPDVHWGRILLTLLEKTGRLETKTEQEVMIRRKLVKFSSNQLIELRKKLTST